MSDFKWYIVHAASGLERKVRDGIYERASKADLSHLFQEILIPAVESVEVRRGKKVMTEKKIMPGYVIIKMSMTDQSYQLVRSVPKIGAFLGSGVKPTAVSDAEVQKILSKASLTSFGVDVVDYEVGSSVKIVDGPFESFVGVVEDVDVSKLRVRVSVSIFGRDTRLDLGFDQVQNV